MATVNLRTNLRRAVTRLTKDLDTILALDVYDAEAASLLFSQLEDKANRLFEIDKSVLQALETQDIDENTFNEEFSTTESYREKFITAKTKFNKANSSARPNGNASCSTEIPSNPSSSATNLGVPMQNPSNPRRYRLPELQLRQFSGDIKEWLNFWNGFKKIHEDKDMDDEDKLQFLLQAMVPNSKAYSLVVSFPLTRGNYQKVVDTLKERFAKDNLLIEVYVRELLSLVLNQFLSKNQLDLGTLFDRLDGQLKALETLGVTQEKYGAMLFPLVESALPTEALQAWERHRSFKEDDSNNNLEYLNSLMEFLKREVNSQQRLDLARAGFNINTGFKNNNNTNIITSSSSFTTPVATSSTPATGNQVSNILNLKCLFCGRNSHLSENCIKAQKMTYEEKRQTILKNNCCLLCLRHGHFHSACKVHVSCIICKQRHATIMCPSLKNSNTESLKRPALDEPSAKDKKAKKSFNSVGKSTNNVAALLDNTKTVYLQTFMIKLKCKGGSFKNARVLMDCASQRSYILRSIVQDFNLDVHHKEQLTLDLFGGIQRPTQTVNVYELDLYNLKGNRHFSLQAIEQNIICNHAPRVADQNILKEAKSKGIALSDELSSYTSVDVLIGADYYAQLLTGRLMPLSLGITAIETLLGWTILGASQTPVSTIASTMISVCLTCTTPTDFWDLEILGIRDPYELKRDIEVEEATVLHFKNTVSRLGDGRYEIKLPWTIEKDLIAGNRFLAERRLLSTTKTLIASDNFERYDAVFNEWLELGIIEEVDDDRRLDDCYYLPHRAVIKESRTTTKVRPVFDATSKKKGAYSLNDAVAKGPNLLKLIPPLLIGFRLNNIGITADIEKAFLQISVSPEDRDYLRFLWWKDEKARVMKLFRHKRVVFGVKTSPFLLNLTILHHLQQIRNQSPELSATAQTLQSCFYVDNCVHSVRDEYELQKFKEESVKIMKLGQFNLREWTHSFQEDETPSKVLGVSWHPNKDVFKFQIELDKVLTEVIGNTLTKRELLSFMQCLFDPLGLISPALLLPKQIFQKACQENSPWDDPLPSHLLLKFSRWISEVPILNSIEIPRWNFAFTCEPDTWSIHIFCDASQQAYGTCIFLRGESPSGDVSLRLLIAKSRIAPSKPTSIPRLELMGALVAVRLWESVKESIPVDPSKVFYWTDSTVLLFWLQKEDYAWNVFVNNRLKEIHKYTLISQWNFVPGLENPADVVSRGCNPGKLISSRWWDGPEWLKSSSTSWPQRPTNLPESLALRELKGTPTTSMIVKVNYPSKPFLKSLLAYFGTYKRIIQMLAWILRFTTNSKPFNLPIQGSLSPKEIDKAEKKLLLLVQQECKGSFDNVGYSVDSQGLLRLKTRLLPEDEEDYFRIPILLPNNHPVVDLLIIHQHQLCKHAGVNTTLALLREKYWIIKGRRRIREILKKCVICQKAKNKPLEPEAGPLPEDRVECVASFQIIGIDLTGAFRLKDNSKVYVVLFTCAIYRGIHLELVSDLTSQSLILALRRFIARRGRPRVIYSDNGRNFLGTFNILSLTDWSEILSQNNIDPIKWKFIPSFSPWWGGWWERLIGVFKDLLKRNLPRAKLNYDEFSTLITECEAVVNARPITFISEDPDEPLPLTPAHFFQDLRSNETDDLDQAEGVSLNKRARHVQKMRKALKIRFKRDYLAALVQRPRGKKCSKGLKVGDLVLVSKLEYERRFWPLGKIEKLVEGRDKTIRLAVVKTEGGENIVTAQRLVPLEVD